MAHLTRFLLQDHDRINRAFDAYKKAPTSLQAALAACGELEVHSTVEEELVYPIVRDEVSGREADAAEKEHAEADEIIAAISDLEPGDPALAELMDRLMRSVAVHIDHEETSIIPALQATLGARVWDVGREAFTLRQELLGQGERPSIPEERIPLTGWSKGSVANAGW